MNGKINDENFSIINWTAKKLDSSMSDGYKWCKNEAASD